MATVKYFPRTTQSVHYDNMATWDVYQTGIPDLTFDDAGVFSLNDSTPSIIIRGGVQQPEPYGWKFGENSRVIMSIYTENLTGSALISGAKLSVKLKDVYKSGTWSITPSLYLVAFTPSSINASQPYYGFTPQTTYKDDINRGVVISDDIIDNAVLIDNARVEFNIDLTKLDVEYGDSPSYGGHTNIAIVTNYDLYGGIVWNEYEYQKYEFYTHTALVDDRPYLELTFTESRSHYFEWFTKEDFAVSDPAGGSSGSGIYDTNLVFHVNANITDSYSGSGTAWNDLVTSGTNKITISGATYSGDAGAKYWSFDGVNDQGTTTPSYDNNGTRGQGNEDLSWESDENWSVECWYKGTTSGGTGGGTTVNNIFGDATGGAYAIALGIDGSGHAGTGYYNSGWNKLSSSTDITDDEWHHVVFTFASSGPTGKIYVDGTLKNTQASMGTFDNYSMIMNRLMNGHGGYQSGAISLVRVYKETLSVENITTNYSAGQFQGGTSGGGDGLVEGEKGDALWDNVTGYYRFNGDFEDRSERSGDIEIIGTSLLEVEGMWAGAGALELSNAYSYRNAIKLEGDTIDFGSGDFCIEFMFKIDENFTLTNGVDYYLMDFREVIPSPSNLEYLVLRSTGGTINLMDHTSAKLQDSTNADFVFVVDTWYHIAVSKDGSNIRIFIDGKCNDANYAVGNYGGQEIWINSRLDNIGSTYNSDGQATDTYIDELRVTTGNKRYAHGSDFTALTQEHYDYEIPTSIGDDHWDQTSLLLKFDETSVYDYSAGTLDLFTNEPIDSSKNQKTVSLQGDPYVAFTAGTFIAGLGSLYLDSNSYLILPDHSEYDFGTDDFTIEFYVKFPTSTHIQWIFSFDGESGENDWRLGINAGGFLTFNQVGNGIASGSSIDFNGTNMGMSDDDWHKVSLCREATSGSLCDMTCHISTEITGSGANQRSQTITTISLVGLNNITTQKYIGYNPANPSDKFVGYLDEVRFTNGTARYSSAVADPYSANDDPIKLLPTIAQYWDYEEPPIGAEIEDTDLSITHFEYILLPFVPERPQFIDGSMQLIALTHRGELLDGVDTRLNRAVTDGSDSDVLFSFNNGSMQFMRYWNESEDDTTLSVANDLVTQEAIDDLVGATLDTSTVTSGEIITDQIFIFEELLPFADLPFLIPTHKDDGVTPALANIDGWTPEQFSFNNNFNITPDYRWDKTGIGTYTIDVVNHQDGLADGSYPISFNFIDGVYVGDSTSVKSLENVHSSFVIGVNEWYSETFDKDVFSSSFADAIYDFDEEIYTPAIDSSGLKTFDDWESRGFNFLNDGFSIIDDMGLNLTEDNYSYVTSYSADNHYGYHLNEVDKVVNYGTISVIDSTDGAKNLYDIEILEEVATIDRDENIINRFKETIVNWFNHVGFAPHVDVLKEIDLNHYIMFTEALSTDSVEHHMSIFKDDGVTLARTGVDEFSDYSFSETFDDIAITDGYDEYTSYETQKNYLNNDVAKWNYTDLLEGTVLDPRIERDLITGMQFISDEEFILSSEFAITSQYLLTSVMGNFWHQSYRFNSGQDTILDMRYSNDYTETFNLSANSFYVTGGNQQDGDIFTIYRDQSDTGSTVLTVLTVEPDPDLKLTDENWSDVELLVTGTNSLNNIVDSSSPTNSSGEHPTFEDTGGEVSGWDLEEMYVMVFDDDTEKLEYSGVTTNGSQVTIDWWGYRDSSDASTPDDEWWTGSTSQFQNVIAQAGSLGTTGKWAFHSTDPASGNKIDFFDVDDVGWHHWAFVKDGSDLYLFVDGDLKAEENSSFTGSITFDTIGGHLLGKIKNFRVTNDVARWTSNFESILYTLKGEWTNDGKIQISPKLGVSLGSIASHTDPIGINDHKISTGTGSRVISGYLQNKVNMATYWGETFASTPTVRNVAGKNVDIRWAWSNGAIPVWDENADGVRAETHPSVLVSEVIETDLKEFYSDSDHFYQFIQAFGNTLDGFGLPAGAGGGDDNWDDVKLLINGVESVVGGIFTESSDSEHSINLNGATQTTSSGGKFGEGYSFSNDIVTLAQSDDFAFGTNDFTVEFWVKWSITNQGQYSRMFMTDSGSNGTHCLQFNVESDLFQLWHYVGGTQLDIKSTTNIVDDQDWHFISASRQSGVIYLHVDGIKENSSAYTESLVAPNGCRIGGLSSGDRYFTGFLDDIRVTKGTGRYGEDNYDVPTETLPTGSGEQPANNMATVPYTDRINPYDSSNTIILREEQPTAYDIELPDSLTSFLSYVTNPAIPGLDDLTSNSFQFNGGNMVVVDSRIKKYDYEPSIYPDVVSDYKEIENTHQLVVNGFGATLDSGQYLDTTVTNDGEYSYASAYHRVNSSSGVREVSTNGGTSWSALGITPIISGGVQTGVSIVDGSYFDNNAYNQPQTIKDPYAVIIEEEIHSNIHEYIIPTEKTVGEDVLPAIARIDTFSQDQFNFSNQGMNITIDSSFVTEYPTTGTYLGGDIPTNSMLKTIFEGRVSLDDTISNQYDVEGNKIIKLQAIFDEVWTLAGQEVVSDIWEQYNTWKSAQWLDSEILEVANFGGDFFQLVNQGFNPVADTVKLTDFTSGTSTNTFLNLVSQVVDDVSFSYDATNNLLTLNLDPAKVDVTESYTVNEYVWVGKLEESVADSNVLDISTYKFWLVNSLNSSTNSVILYIPPGDASIVLPTGEAPTGDLTVLLSSTSMVDLMYYHRRV